MVLSLEKNRLFHTCLTFSNKEPKHRQRANVVIFGTHSSRAQNMKTIEETISSIAPPCQEIIKQAKNHVEMLAIPRGSLGRLNDLAIKLAGITSSLKPVLKKKVIFTLAGDHGVTSQGVSAFPSEVTFQMVKNFIGGGASINAFADVADAEVMVADFGVNADLGEFRSSKMFADKKVRMGTDDFSSGPAMSRQEAILALSRGIELAIETKEKRGLDIAGTGDMGIGNTTPSSAITSVLTQSAVSEVTGRGTGIDQKGLEKKVQTIEKGLSINKPDPDDGIDILAKVGGFEIGGIAGLILGCASLGVPVVIDGFISSAGGLIAHKLCPTVSEYMIPSHQSVEKGHLVALKRMNIYPAYINLDLRLGEGTGAALMFPLIDAANKLLTDIETFKDARIAEQI